MLYNCALGSTMTPQARIRQILETQAQAVTGWDPTADELFDLPSQTENSSQTDLAKMVDLELV
jgi:hypothetical protein